MSDEVSDEVSDEAGAGRDESRLKRQVGVGGAIVLGLGSIVGTGVFVSIGIAVGVIGPAVIAAIAVAGLVAACNALSSAQLAANHPCSGGTYEYGHCPKPFTQTPAAVRRALLRSEEIYIFLNMY